MTWALVRAFVASNLKPIIAGFAVGSVVFLFLAFQHERSARQAAESERDNARLQVIAQTGQSTLNNTAAQAVDQAQDRALNITVKAQEAAHVVQSAVGADTPLPPAVRAATLDALRELRDEAVLDAVPDDPGSAKPQGAVPTPGG